MEIVLGFEGEDAVTWKLWKEGGEGRVSGWPLAGCDVAVRLDREPFHTWFPRMMYENMVVPSSAFGGRGGASIRAVYSGGDCVWRA